MGNILWKWLDGLGVDYMFIITKIYYVPDGQFSLLTPQYWSKYQQKDKRGNQYVGSKTLDDWLILFYNGRKNQLTFPLDDYNNVSTMQLAP